MIRLFPIGFALAAGLLLIGCNPKVDVLAPEKELFVVYGVLNPARDSQFVRVSKVFQTKDDAFVYAAENDLTARGLKLSLEGGDKSLEAELIPDYPKEEGIFGGGYGLYVFHTKGANALQPGMRYHLRATKPDDPDFLMTAWTDIPTQPVLTHPGPPLFSPQSQRYTFNTVDFEEDVQVRFLGGSGEGFELRLYVEYWDGADIRRARFGPTRIFRDPTGCTANTEQGKMCYELRERAISSSLFADIVESPGPIRHYDTLRVSQSLDSLSKVAWMEVTAVDTFLTSFLHANTPFGFGLNMLMDKPEVSNISGDNAGIFGSINSSSQFLFLGSCTKYRSGLVNVQPGNCD